MCYLQFNEIKRREKLLNSGFRPLEYVRLGCLFVLTYKLEHGGLDVLFMVDDPVLPGPSICPIELRVTFKELCHEQVSLAGLFELPIEPKGEELGCAYLDALVLLLLYHGHDVWLKSGEEAW